VVTRRHAAATAALLTALNRMGCARSLSSAQTGSHVTRRKRSMTVSPFLRIHRGAWFIEDDSCGWSVLTFRHHPPAVADSTPKVIDSLGVQSTVEVCSVRRATLRTVRSSGADWILERACVNRTRLQGGPNAEAIRAPPILHERRQHNV